MILLIYDDNIIKITNLDFNFNFLIKFIIIIWASNIFHIFLFMSVLYGGPISTPQFLDQIHPSFFIYLHIYVKSFLPLFLLVYNIQNFGFYR